MPPQAVQDWAPEGRGSSEGSSWSGKQSRELRAEHSFGEWRRQTPKFREAELAGSCGAKEATAQKKNFQMHTGPRASTVYQDAQAQSGTPQGPAKGNQELRAEWIPERTSFPLLLPGPPFVTVYICRPAHLIRAHGSTPTLVISKTVP